MERRNFIRLSVASIGAGIIAPTMALANTEKQVKGASDIYYTKEDPGRWSGKVATHLPNIEIERADGKITVKVVTPHEMKGYEHYIIKHVLLDSNHKFLDEHLFDPTKDTAAISTFTLQGYSGALYVLSMCNKHDLWLNSTEVGG
ncbi:MAG: desulfoferrodoxin family protein [Methylococcaceae bacterium]